MEALTKSLKTELKKQLQRSKDRSFDEEFIRTTNLEREIVDKYGFEGIKLITKERGMNNLVELGKFPADCPWHVYNGKTIPELIDLNFESITGKIPELLDALKDRCNFIYAGKRKDHWFLNYFLDIDLYDGRAYYRIYEGGAPNPNPVPNKNLLRYNWEIPDDLKTFYAIHDGFGEDCTYILSSKDISIMAKMMDPICKEQNSAPEGYSFKDLLEFFPDGMGNAQCFHKNGSNNTVDWDHEVWEISEEQDFFSFIDERMSYLDEE